MNIKYPIEDPHSLAAEEVLHSLQADAVAGISSAEAGERNKQFGPNIYQAQKQQSIWAILLKQFTSPIVYVLVAGVAVSFYFGDNIEAIAIAIVILLNALIGFFMELQARRSMNALKKMDVILSKVIRDAKLQEIPSENITPGDIISFEAGDVIPGDARLVEANQLQCDESSLTGESLPAEKNTEPVAKDAALGDRHNMVFKGTSVINGNGKAVITGIAQNTELGTITSLVETATENATPLDRKLKALTKKLIWITLAMTVIYAVTGIIQQKAWLQIIETSIALAVAAIPEGLPIVATVALAYGMLLMAKKKAIVKNLSAVETLGSTNVILTDKTGTLTENKIYIDSFSFAGEEIKAKIENKELKFENGQVEKSKENFEKLKLTGALANNANPEPTGKKKASGDPIEIALINLANTGGTSAETFQKEYERIAEVPFSSDTKLMGTLHQTAKGQFAAAKGSVEHLLEKCSQIQKGASVTGLNESGKKEILVASEKMAAEGLRVLAFAYREGTGINKDDFLNGLVYVGMAGFLDPPRLDIKDAITSCRTAGIKVVMITGDHPATALNIAKKTGLADEGEQNVITGSDLPDMDAISPEWKEKILAATVFARTTPKQKLDIAGIYQEAGNIVAMTGDGVNDAPALKKADIGIAMGLRGTQVAKETANIILKDDSFTSIAEAVAHGRAIFQNIQKFVTYLVSCNLGEILIVTALGFLAPASNLLPLQILFLNMVTDVFPALALGVGRGDEDVMKRPPRDPAQSIITRRNWMAIGIYATTMAMAVVLAVFWCKQVMGLTGQATNNAAFLTLTFTQLFHVFNMASHRSGFLVNDITTNRFVWLALLTCCLLLGLVYILPQVRIALHLAILPYKVWVVSILAGLLPLVLVQVYKLLRGRRTEEPVT